MTIAELRERLATFEPHDRVALYDPKRDTLHDVEAVQFEEDEEGGFSGVVVVVGKRL